MGGLEFNSIYQQLCWYRCVVFILRSQVRSLVCSNVFLRFFIYLINGVRVEWSRPSRSPIRYCGPGQKPKVSSTQRKIVPRTEKKRMTVNPETQSKLYY